MSQSASGGAQLQLVAFLGLVLNKDSNSHDNNDETESNGSSCRSWKKNTNGHCSNGRIDDIGKHEHIDTFDRHGHSGTNVRGSNDNYDDDKDNVGNHEENDGDTDDDDDDW